MIAKKKNKPTALDNLEAITDLYRERSLLYKDNYKVAGVIFKQLFPTGVNIETIEDYNRMAIWMQIINKVIRYSYNWDKGHNDSLNDIAVYTMILKELDDEYIGDE